MKKITQILIDIVGWKYYIDGDIIEYDDGTGERYSQIWYKQTFPDGRYCIYNGRYVIEVRYE